MVWGSSSSAFWDEEPTINRAQVHPVLRGELIAGPRPAEARVPNGASKHPRDPTSCATRNCCRFIARPVLVPRVAGHGGRGAGEAGPVQKQGAQGRGEQGGRSACLREAASSPRRSSSWGWTTRRPRRWKKSYRMAWDWQPDLANWAMYTPWPFHAAVPRSWATRSRSSISRNTISVTPIMKPEAMDRDELLDPV